MKLLQPQNKSGATENPELNIQRRESQRGA